MPPTLHVHRQARLLRHELREVHWEAKGVPQQEGVGARDLAVSGGSGGLLEALNALDEGAAEAGLLLSDGLQGMGVGGGGQGGGGVVASVHMPAAGDVLQEMDAVAGT
jgi:hypothetical protein